jgi:hypothetical protein
VLPKTFFGVEFRPGGHQKAPKVLTLRAYFGSGGRDRTYDQLINSAKKGEILQLFTSAN